MTRDEPEDLPRRRARSPPRVRASDLRGYRDYAETNAQDLMDLLAGIDADVDPPPAPAKDG
jgi:hypothetical protein